MNFLIHYQALDENKAVILTDRIRIKNVESEAAARKLLDQYCLLIYEPCNYSRVLSIVRYDTFWDKLKNLFK